MSLASLIVCPTCRAALQPDGAAWTCRGCAVDYPAVDGIPWLLPDPTAALWEWKGRLKHLLQRLDADAEGLKAELKDEALPELTKKRLRKLLQAKVEHRKAMSDMLAPLAAAETGSLEMSRALAVKLPSTQTITGYYTNIHRDWAWETSENAASLAAVEAVLAPGRELGTLLALGAGAARLPYDLHLSRKPRLTVAADLNPLMLLAARRVLKGKSLKLYEFPLAPRDLDSHAVLRKCAAPDASAKGVAGFELVFADALRPAFADGVFDTVLTPWLIDILPSELTVLAARINKLLKPGGVWINFGSLAFNNAAQAQNYSYEEVLERVEATGFTDVQSRRTAIPYMQSPASCHGRLETVTTFAATKAREADSPAWSYLPAWLTDVTRPVPRGRAVDGSAAVHQVLVEVLALIDGARSVRDMAAAFGARHGLQPEEAEASIRGFLVRHFEENAVGGQY